MGLQRFVEAQLPPESVVLDVGANIGLTTCIFSQVASRVHAFEPNPDVFPLLEKNISCNRLVNVTAHQLALSDQSGEMNFDGESAYGHLTQEQTSRSVKVETIDRMVDALGLSRLDFLKIDVEGFEPRVLEGARRTISRFNPVIYMEFNSWALMTIGDMNPFDFARALVSDFSQVAIVNDTVAGRSQTSDPREIVAKNIFEQHSVSDLILCKQPRILRLPVPKSQTDQAETVAALRHELADLRNSTSWRATAPLRWLRRQFRL